MAYIIPANETKTNIYKIAENDYAKSNLYLHVDHLSEVISDSDFAALKNHTKVVSGHDGTNYIYSDHLFEYTEEMLSSWLSAVSKALKISLERYPNHPDASLFTTYKNVVDSFDPSTVTFPLNKSWEKHCEDSSIPYINLLQLP